MFCIPFWRLFSSKRRQSNLERDVFRTQARPRQYVPPNYSTFSPPRVQVQTRPPPPPPISRRPVPAPAPVIRAAPDAQSALLPPLARKAIPTSYYSRVSTEPREDTSLVPPLIRKKVALNPYRPPTGVEVTPKANRPSFNPHDVPPKYRTLASVLASVPTIEATPQLPKPPPKRLAPVPATKALTTTTTTTTTSSLVQTQTITCYICLDVHKAVPNADVVRAPCNDHWYCLGCLRTLFIAATKNEGLFPPSCCRKPFGQSPVFLLRFLKRPQELASFLHAAREFATPVRERVYCASASCRNFLTGKGSVEMSCGKCGGLTCKMCKERMHQGVCKDKAAEEMEAMKALAEEEGWMWCRRCGGCVELLGGCNHMTCRCNYEFCYICGLEWKTCACTRETPRRGRLGERLALRPAAANARNLMGAPARARIAAMVVHPPQITRPENSLATRLRAVRAQATAPERAPQTAPQRVVVLEAVPTLRNTRSGRGGRGGRGGAVTRAANISGAERAATVSNVVATRQARCQVHTIFMWRKQQRSGTCGMCRNFMPRFIFECSACGMDACARCSGK